MSAEQQRAGVRRPRPASHNKTNVTPDPEPLLMSVLRAFGALPAAQTNADMTIRRRSSALRAYAAPLDLPTREERSPSVTTSKPSLGARLTQLKRCLLRQRNATESPELAARFESVKRLRTRAHKSQSQLDAELALSEALLQAVTDLESDGDARCSAEELTLRQASKALHAAVQDARRVTRFTETSDAASRALENRDVLRAYRRSWEQVARRSRKAAAEASRAARPVSLRKQQQLRETARAQHRYDAHLTHVCRVMDALLQQSLEAQPLLDELKEAQFNALLALRALAGCKLEDSDDEDDDEWAMNAQLVRARAGAVYKRYWQAFQRTMHK